jgi:NAD(P)-dependent dehydrogenase (short-subunit alcohol dehydrogenase family)
MSKPTAIVVGVGAEEGLGAALSRRFSREGRHVFVAGRTREKIEKVVATIRLAAEAHRRSKPTRPMLRMSRHCSRRLTLKSPVSIRPTS